MENEKVLVVGCTGQVALPVAQALATHNEVVGIARFNSRRARRVLEDSGVECQVVDLSAPDLSGLAQDFTYVLNFSVARTGSWTTDLDINVGAIALVMEHCRSAACHVPLFDRRRVPTPVRSRVHRGRSSRGQPQGL